MKKEFVVKRGNNMPVQAPLIPDPFVPYKCPENKTITAYCEVKPDIVKKYLEGTPFKYVDNKFIVTISDFGNCDKGSFFDCAIVLPVMYKETLGGHFLFEYEDEDFSIAAGRELWGYPKKYAELFMEEKEGKVIAKAIKNGEEIIRLEMDITDFDNVDIPDIQVTPHLNMHTIPNGDGPGIFSQRIISRDTSEDFQLTKKVVGDIKLTLKSVKNNPLAEFTPDKIYGGTYVIGDFYANEKNGWGKVIDTII